MLDELALRRTQVREVRVAFVSQGKVMLDLLAQALAAALGNPGGFQEKHGSLGTRLDDFARGLGVAAPPDELVQRACELDRDVADVRDDLLVHPKLSAPYARQCVHPRGGDLEISTVFPNEEEASLISTAKLDSALDAYTLIHELALELGIELPLDGVDARPPDDRAHRRTGTPTAAGQRSTGSGHGKRARAAMTTICPHAVLPTSAAPPPWPWRDGSPGTAIVP